MYKYILFISIFIICVLITHEKNSIKIHKRLEKIKTGSSEKNYNGVRPLNYWYRRRDPNNFPVISEEHVAYFHSVMVGNQYAVNLDAPLNLDEELKSGSLVEVGVEEVNVDQNMHLKTYYSHSTGLVFYKVHSDLGIPHTIYLAGVSNIADTFRLRKSAHQDVIMGVVEHGDGTIDVWATLTQAHGEVWLGSGYVGSETVHHHHGITSCVGHMWIQDRGLPVNRIDRKRYGWVPGSDLPLEDFVGAEVPAEIPRMYVAPPIDMGTELGVRVLKGTNRGTHSDQDRWAIDFETPIGTPVHAVHAGRVIMVQGDTPDTANAENVGVFDDDSHLSGNGGHVNQVVIMSKDGSLTQYMHLQQQDFSKILGVELKQGDLIGTTGFTGNIKKPGIHMGAMACRPQGHEIKLVALWLDYFKNGQNSGNGVFVPSNSGDIYKKQGGIIKKFNRKKYLKNKKKE